jgi:hypothetical protein
MILTFLKVVAMVSSLLLDFGSDAAKNWSVVNDGVMGGLSKGAVRYTDSTLVFSGNISLENNGGFSSLRGPLGQYDLSDYETVTIRHRGFGGTFGFRLKTQDTYYLPYFKMEFTPGEEWQNTSFQLAEFPQWRMSQKTGSQISSSDLERIIHMGIIKSDKKPGDFRLEVAYIEFE